jgi:hydrogenase maturation factor HypF (carbamoyltransferase family)
VQSPEIYHHNELAEDLINVLSRCPKEEGYTPDIHKQEKILRSLPENTAENLYAHLYAVQKEQDYFAQIRGDETGNVHDGIVLRGEVLKCWSKPTRS